MSYSQHIQARRHRRRPTDHPMRAPAGEEPMYPAGIEQADVVFLIGMGPPAGWWETRGKLLVDLLAERGITAIAASLSGEDRLAGLIERLQPRIVVNQAMRVSPETIGQLAARHRKIQFVNKNHSSLSFLISEPTSWERYWGGFWALAETRDNCYLASPDERNVPAVIRPDLARKILVLPNPARVPAAMDRPMGDPPLVSLICAGRPQKNIPNQLAGYALARRRQELRLWISCRGYEDRLRQMCKALRIEAEISPWLDWQDYMHRLAEVDVGLQVSNTESFNYVGLEHLLCGVPVVGSDALRFLPDKWQAHPDRPEDIARHILDRLERWEDSSREARQLAERFVATRNRQFQAEIARLLDG